MIELYSNNAVTTLAGAISNVSVTVQLAPGSGALFPNPSSGQFFRMTLTDALTGLIREITYCTARSGDVCTVTRGQEGTTANAYLAGDSADNYNTAGAMANLGQAQQIQQNLFNYAADTGTANSYIVTLSPTSLSTPVAGAPIYFTAANANNGASTLTVNGGTSYPLLGNANAALQGGEILANGLCVATFSVTLSSYILIDCTGGASQVVVATASKQAAQLSQVGFQNMAVYEIQSGVQKVSINGAAFTTTGATTFPKPISGIAKVRGWGGGGGGGGTQGSGAFASAGGGGGYFEGVFTGIPGTQTITVGVGGTAGAASPTAGGTGGTTSFGSLATANGGGGGNAQSGAGYATGPAGGTSTGASLLISGSSGGVAFPLSSGAALAIGGGAFGAGNSAIFTATSASSGAAGVFPGGGAGGSGNGSVGLVGSNGLLIVEY